MMTDYELNDLNESMRAIALEMGATHYGIGDMTQYYGGRPDAFEAYGKGKLLTGISILVPENNAMLTELPMSDDLSRTSHYNIKIVLAQQIVTRLSVLLIEKGFEAAVHMHPGPPGGGKPTGLLKAGARFAGLGWIGKNRLLITKDYGPRVCPGLLLTDAPFERAAKVRKLLDGCGNCTRCVQICPSQAFSADPFTESDTMGGFNTGRCAEVRGIINPTGWGACSLCVQACPFGAANKDRAPAFHDAFPILSEMPSESPV
jgi:ferredoxin